MVRLLVAGYGGKWVWNRANHTWECDDGRYVRTCCVIGGFTGDEVVGRETYLYHPTGSGKSPELVSTFTLMLDYERDKLRSAPCFSSKARWRF